MSEPPVTPEGVENTVLALDNQLCFALYAANRAMTSLYRPLLAELGLTYPQYLVMLVLWEAEAAGQEVSVSWLGRRLRLDSGTLTPLLKRLAAADLVTRQRSGADERVVTIALTPQGRDLKARAMDVPVRLLCQSGMAPERLQALREELKTLLSLMTPGGASTDG